MNFSIIRSFRSVSAGSLRRGLWPLFALCLFISSDNASTKPADLANTKLAENVTAPPAVSQIVTPPALTTKPKIKTSAKKSTIGVVTGVTDDELKLLKKLDSNYQKQSAEMSVKKTTKMPLLDQLRTEQGTLWISSGRLRMELQGDSKTALIVNKKNLWAIMYPPAEFKDAKLKVVKGDTTTKKGRSHSFITLLSQGGFLKFFVASGAQKDAAGNVLFFLSPLEEQVDFRRAEVKISADGKKLLALNYWDDRDNETRMEFSGMKSEKIDDNLFNYIPPADADLLNI